MEVVIKQVSLSELPVLLTLGKATFTQTFSEHNSPEDMEKYLSENFNITKLTSEFNHPNSTFYFAQVLGQNAGFSKLNTGAAQTEKLGEEAFELERIYVDQIFLGKKVGQALLDHAIATAKQGNHQFIWLGVWEENHRAINFYQKNGFEVFDKHIFKLGNDEQTDLLMKLIL